MSLNYSSNRGFPAGNPIANAIVVVVGALAIAASVVLGFFAFLLLASLIAVFAAILGVRVWWYRRGLKRKGGATPGERRPTTRSEVIEGEFQVIKKGPGSSDDR